MPDHGPTTTRRRDRFPTWRVAVAVAAIAATVLLAGGATALATPSPSTTTPTDAGTPGAPVSPQPAATAPPTPLVRAGDDVKLRYGETVETVVVFGGDADIAGTVRTAVVVIGGDAIIRGTAVIGSTLTERDAAIVVVGGEVRETPGAQVTGTTQVVSLTAPRIDIVGGLWHRITHPGISVAGWFSQVIFLSLVSLAVVALFPRPVRAVRDRAFVAPLASLGWGALTAFMAGVVALILAATIIGLVIVVPVAVVSPFFGGFVYAAAAFALGDLLLSRIWPGEKSRYLAAVTGVLVLALVGLIPVAGGLATMAIWLTGLGATAVAIVEWRRARQASQAAAQPTEIPPAGGPS
jgi:hypothetical protein